MNALLDKLIQNVSFEKAKNSKRDSTRPSFSLGVKISFICLNGTFILAKPASYIMMLVCRSWSLNKQKTES